MFLQIGQFWNKKILSLVVENMLRVLGEWVEKLEVRKRVKIKTLTIKHGGGL